MALELMLLKLPMRLALGYKSKSQIARVTTEAWISGNFYCPSCAKFELLPTPPNTKVVDFSCRNCHEKFQIKSKAKKFSTSLRGANYQATLHAIKSGENPSVIALTYCPNRYVVLDVKIIHRFGISESSIKASKPLGKHTQRAGDWQGFDYLLKKIRGRYFIPAIRKSNPRIRFLVAKKFQMISNTSFQPNR